MVLADLIESLYERHYDFDTYKNRRIDGEWITGELLGKGNFSI
jgi:hypothetical protein